MENTLPLELLRGAWLMSEDALGIYKAIAYAYLTGDVKAVQELKIGLFSKISLPSVPDDIAMVVMNGALTKADVCGNEGTRSLTNKVLNAAASPNIKGILIYAENCPGGQVDGTKAMADAVAEARKVKPTIGAFSGMCGSGGVWILSQTAESYATSATDMVGCIGAMATLKNPKKLKEDEDFIEVYSSLSPKKNEEFRDMDAMRKNILDPTAELFHKDVKSGRGNRLKLDKEDVLAGSISLAGAGVKNGLIDGIMPINKIIARIQFLARTQKSK